MTSKSSRAGTRKPTGKTTPTVAVEPAPVQVPVQADPVAQAVAVTVEPVAQAVEIVAEPVVEAVEELTEAAPQIEEIIEDTAPQMAETIAKGSDIMEATIEKTQAMFAEMNERAKAAFEKNSKMVAEATEFAKGNVEALVESGKITAKGLETLGQDAADYSRKSFESATATLKSLSSVKTPADFFKLQGEFVRSSFDAVVAESSKNTEAFIKLASDATQPISSRFALAVEKVKTAA